jgi:hypothetical protein
MAASLASSLATPPITDLNGELALDYIAILVSVVRFDIALEAKASLLLMKILRWIIIEIVHLNCL